MNIPESLIHSFIVKIWLEDAESAAGKKSWRGQITHVPSGKRRSIQQMDDIQAFIDSYLEGNDE